MKSLSSAAEAIRHAESILITAGSGMSASSGLPTFRDAGGFWNKYSLFKELQLDFISLANPKWFRLNPKLAWLFYGHRFNLYKQTKPHAGFDILKRWGQQKNNNFFIFTSNVDGHFQKSGFHECKIHECHGSINFFQCLNNCDIIFKAEEDLKIEIEKLQIREPLPSCKVCGNLCRPNILMFGDYEFNNARAADQSDRLDEWISKQDLKKTVVIEIGAGSMISSVRNFSELIAKNGASLIRINPEEPETPARGISIRMKALEALTEIDKILNNQLI